MIRFVCALALLATFAALLAPGLSPPAKTETLSCVRVKEVTPAGAINYLCGVRK